MKRVCLVISIVLSCICPAEAQQTYFNVPSSDIVNKREVSVQQQINISESIRSSTTIEFGLGNEWEVGLNFYNLDCQPADRRVMTNDSTIEKSYSPLLLFNTQGRSI